MSDNQKPGICRIVQVRGEPYPSPSPDDPEEELSEAAEDERWNAALIVDVHDDGRINVVVWDQYGNSHAMAGVEQGTKIGQWRWPPRA